MIDLSRQVITGTTDGLVTSEKMDGVVLQFKLLTRLLFD